MLGGASNQLDFVLLNSTLYTRMYICVCIQHVSTYVSTYVYIYIYYIYICMHGVWKFHIHRRSFAHTTLLLPSTWISCFIGSVRRVIQMPFRAGAASWWLYQLPPSRLWYLGGNWSIHSFRINKPQMCHGQARRYIGDGKPPTFNRNPYNGYVNPYYWVDDHPLLYGNNGSLDPGTDEKYGRHSGVALCGNILDHRETLRPSGIATHCGGKISPVGVEAKN